MPGSPPVTAAPRARARRHVRVANRRQAQRHRHGVGPAVRGGRGRSCSSVGRARGRRAALAAARASGCCGGCGSPRTSAGARSASPRTRATRHCWPRRAATPTCTRCGWSICCRACSPFVIAAPILVGGFEAARSASSPGSAWPLGRRRLLRGRRRRADGAVPRRPGEQGQGHRRRVVALHPAPELLRRRLRVVGDLPRRRRRAARRAHGLRAGAV